MWTYFSQLLKIVEVEVHLHCWGGGGLPPFSYRYVYLIFPPMKQGLFLFYAPIVFCSRSFEGILHVAARVKAQGTSIHLAIKGLIAVIPISFSIIIYLQAKYSI